MMNNSYLNQLKSEISVLPKIIQQQIVSDFESFSQEALTSGKTEIDFEKEFGNPREIALSYIKEEFSDKSKTALYYDKLLTELISILFLVAFIPINLWIMTQGYYGQLPNNFENPTPVLLKAFLMDPIFILAVIVGIVVAIRIFRTNKNRYRLLTETYRKSEKVLALIPSALLVLVYFTYHGTYRYIALGILVQTTLVAAVYIFTRILTTKNID